MSDNNIKTHSIIVIVLVSIATILMISHAVITVNKYSNKVKESEKIAKEKDTNQNENGSMEEAANKLEEFQKMLETNKELAQSFNDSEDEVIYFMNRVQGDDQYYYITSEHFDSIPLGESFKNITELIGLPDKEEVSKTVDGGIVKVYQGLGEDPKHSWIYLTFKDNVLVEKHSEGLWSESMYEELEKGTVK